MIAEILFEVAWKSTVVSAVVVLLLIVMRKQTASDRVAVGGLGLAMILLLPALVMGLAYLPVPSIEFVAPVEAPEVAIPLAVDPAPAQFALDHSAALASEPAATVSPAVLAILFWAVGVLAVGLRLIAGLTTLARWSRQARVVDTPFWNGLLRRAGAPEGTSLRISDEVTAPLSWGWRKPAILIDRETLACEAEAEAVIAHEAAHLSRGDWPRLIAARVAVALFWFNPFVWLLERLYLQDVEEAADAQATSLVDPAHYAQVLLNAARNAAVPVGAHGMSSGSLAKRIHKVLNGRSSSRWDGTWRAGALAGVAMVAGPVALVQFVAPAVSAAAEPVLAPIAIASTRSAAEAPSAPTASIATPGTSAVAPAAPVALAERVAAVATVAPVAAVAVAHQTPVVAPMAPMPPMPPIDQEEIERVKRAAAEIRAQSAIIARDSQKIAERARAEARAALRNSRQPMLQGAESMDRGAIEMRRGAAQMREEARKLRDPAYRAKVIAEARENNGRWGGTSWGNKVPTDQELIDAIPKMENGARKMDEGVEKMREGAERMRQSARRHDD